MKTEALHDEYLRRKTAGDPEGAFKALLAETELLREHEEKIREQLIQSALERKEMEDLKRQGQLLTEGNNELERSNSRLNRVLEQIEVLQGLLPVCVSCKKVRTDSGYWKKLEEYLSEYTDAELVESLCEDCESEGLN